MLGPNGLVYFFSNFTKSISKLQSGTVYNYAFVLFIGVTGFLIVINNLMYFNLELMLLLPFFIYALNHKNEKE